MQRTLSVIGTAALALTGVIALGTSVATASPGDIAAPQGGGSIIVHKHSSNPGAAGTGFEITDPGAKAALGSGIGDIPFSLYRVAYNGDPLDFSDPDDWRDDLPTTEAQATSGGYTLVDMTPAAHETDATGLLTFSGLPLGLYMVKEEPNPVINAGDMAGAFFVSVPHRSADQSSWNYNVHVYPKNKLPDVKIKEVADPTGDTVVWTIRVNVPRPASGQTYSGNMTITDTLDNRLTYVSSTIAKNGGAAAAATPTVVGQLVTWTIPQANLVTGDTYEIKLTTTVAASATGEIPNTAYRNLEGNSVPTNTVQSNWGAVKVIKKETGTEATLAGAKFDLRTACTGGTLLGQAETGTDGTVTFPHIWLGNGTTTTMAVCLIETQAPTGHSIVGNGQTPVTLNAAGTGIVEKTIHNPPRTTPNLPLTGSAGTAAFMAGGLALLLTATGAALIVSRRRREHPTTR